MKKNEPCFGHNSTHKAPLVDLKQRFFMNFCVDYESAIKTNPYFYGFCVPDSIFTKNIIYDIGTKILFLQLRSHNSTQKAPFCIIPEDSGSWGRLDSLSAIKTQPFFDKNLKKRPRRDLQCRSLCYFSKK